MDDIRYHLSLFPPRLRTVLEAFDPWDTVYEIRLRSSGPLSLTGAEGNIFLDQYGKASPPERGICCQEEELRQLLGSFCRGNVYRYFDRLQDGFAVDEFGWRLGISTVKNENALFLPKRMTGINLRIPRQDPKLALPVAQKMGEEGLFSLLIFSAPGEGKTTFLRSLAALLSLGFEGTPPVRVAVIDENQELFPLQMNVKTGLLDLLPSVRKEEGIGMATRLFSPQVILCDEIGSAKESEAVLNACSGGCYIVATAHAASRSEAERIPYLHSLIRSGRFAYALFLKKEKGAPFRLRFHWEALG